MKFSWLRDRTDHLPNETHLGMVLPLMGLVLHQEQGTEAGSDSWFHNPKAQASAHFGGPKQPYSAQLLGDQWVDTNDKAWAEASGNPHWWAIEMEGYGEPLTANQIEIAARLMAELHLHHGVKLVTTDSVTQGGLGWHGMGGLAWGGHPQCGKNFRSQRGQILTRALHLAGGGVRYHIVNDTDVRAAVAHHEDVLTYLAVTFNVPGGRDGLLTINQRAAWIHRNIRVDDQVEIRTGS